MRLCRIGAGLLGCLLLASAASCGETANAIIKVSLNGCHNATLIAATSMVVTLTDGKGRKETHDYQVDGMPEALTATLPGDTPNPITVDVLAKGAANQQGSASTGIVAGEVTSLNVCLTPVNNAYKVTATLDGTPVASITHPTITPGSTGFKVDHFAFQTPSTSDHTRFAEVVLVYTQTLLDDPSQAVIIALGPMSPSGTLTVTICQAGAVGDPAMRNFACRTDVPPQQTVAQAMRDGTLTGGFASVQIPPLVVDAFSFTGSIDMTTHKLSAFVDGVLTVSKYCDFALPTPGDICGQGVANVNLLDLLDGPADNCGADNSVKDCTPSSDAAGHHPADSFVQGP